MPVVRGEDGSLRLRTSDGLDLPWALGEGSLANLGYEIPPHRIDPAATAQNLPPEALAAMAGQGHPQAHQTRQIPDIRSAPAPVTQGQIEKKEAEKFAADAKRGRIPDAEIDSRRAELTKDHGVHLNTEESAAAKARALRGGGEVKPAPDVAQGGGQQFDQPRFTRIKGGDQRAAFSVQRGADRETLEGVGEAIGRSAKSEITARDYEGEQEAALRGYEAQQLDQQIADQHQAVAAGRERIQRVREELDAKQIEIDGERAKVAALEQDPHNYWANRSTGTKIVAAIGAIAGGMLAGLKGGPNQNIEHIQNAIAEDMAAHRARIAAREKGANIKQDELDKLRERMDPDLAEREVEARKLAVAGAMMRRFALKTGNPALIARMNADADKIEADAKARWAGISQEMGDRVVEQWRYIPDRVVQTGGARPVKDIGRIVVLPDGTRTWARTDAQAKEQQGNVEANSEIAEIAKQIRALRSEPENRMPLSEKRAAIQTLSGRMFLAIKKGENLGTLDKGALDFREEYQGKPEALLSPGADARLGQLQAGAEDRLENTKRYYLTADPEGTTPVQAPRGERQYEP